jgi:hypothetical protein
MATQSGVFSQVLRTNVLFMTTSDPNDGLQLWDVSNPLGPPVRYDTSPLNIQQGASAGTDCYGNLLYIAQRSNRAMQVIGPFMPFNYTLNSQNASISLVQGSSGSNSINASLASGISQNVTFTKTIPVGATGVTASFSPSKCSPDCSTSITLNTTAATPPGTYPITITGTGGITTTFNLVVTPSPFDYSLTNSGDINVKQTKTGTVTVNSALVSGTGKPITITISSTPVLPASISLTPDKTVCTPTCVYTLSIVPATDPATRNKSYTITINGSASDIGTRSTSFVLTVKP